MKIAQQMKRTGQSPAGMVPGNVIGGGNGSCGPAPATSTRSWGAACPTGACSADQLAANLNRTFAGERYPCRELTYWIKMTADGSGVCTFNQNSKVTICPTRVIAFEDSETSGLLPVAGPLLTVFEIGNQNQIVGDPIPLALLNPSAYQIIPFVTDCIKAGMPFNVTITGATAGTGVVYFGIVGPAIG